MKNIITMSLLAGFLLLASCHKEEKIIVDNSFLNFEPTSSPDRIMMSIPSDPASTRAISWRTVYSDTNSIGQIIPLTPSPALEDSAKQISGSYKAWEIGDNKAMGHKVIFENLQANSKYAYRVGNGTQWSEWFQFTTSSNKIEPFSFLYFGDVQNDIKSKGSRILRQAYSNFPDVDFMLFAGDLVSRSTEEYWREFFYAGGWIFGMMPSIPTPGNHEYNKTDSVRTFSNHWNQIYTMPNNGPSPNLDNRVYYLDYQGVRFISVDSPAMGYTEETSDLILNWLEETLQSNPNKWTIVFTHFPVYSCSMGRNNENYRTKIQPVLEKYGVDLVLQGHDHSYCRGQNLENKMTESTNYPMYVVSVAGPKMYGLNTSFWSDRMASNTQLYQNISVDGNKISFETYTVTGELYDNFRIEKNRNGKNTIVIDPQFNDKGDLTNIPERAVQKYDQEQLEKYQEFFK